jgi:hypothetical protein
VIVRRQRRIGVAERECRDRRGQGVYIMYICVGANSTVLNDMSTHDVKLFNVYTHVVLCHSLHEFAHLKKNLQLLANVLVLCMA